ncbi:MAG: uroporphyrinogen-III synthase [Erythrobacter sp.]
MGGYVLVVRPEPGLSNTVAAADAMGLNAIGYPLFEVVPRAWDCPSPDAIDALLIGSANAIRHGGDRLEQLKTKPVYAVGQTTAETAREHGFAVAGIGVGGLQNVVDQIPAQTRLLRIAGAQHVELNAPKDVFIRTIIAYESIPQELPEPLRPLHDLGLTVLLHSAAAAEQFVRESRRLALQRGRITLVVIGPRVAQAAGTGWRAVHVANTPNDRAMLEMALELNRTLSI